MDMSETQGNHSIATADGGTDVDRWFAAIDQRQIGTGPLSWVAQVVGIYPDGHDLWVQVSATHAPESTVLLRVSEDSTVESAVTLLREQSRWPGSRTQIIDGRVHH